MGLGECVISCKMPQAVAPEKAAMCMHILLALQKKAPGQNIGTGRAKGKIICKSNNLRYGTADSTKCVAPEAT